jgi:hypothetical protein
MEKCLLNFGSNNNEPLGYYPFIRKLGQFQKGGWVNTKGEKSEFLISRNFCEYLHASVN